MFLSGGGPIAFFALGGSRYRIVALSKDRPDPVPLEFFEEAAKVRVPFRVMEASGFAIRAVSVTNPIVRGVQSAARSLVGSLEPIQARIRSALSELVPQALAPI